MNLMEYKVKPPTFKEFKMSLILEIQKKMLKQLKLEGLVGHLVWI